MNSEGFIEISMEKKVSIIMGIYNCENTLEEALDSLIDQTYKNWEVILCDDGSIDHTKRIAQKYVEKYPSKFILLENKENRGLNYTLNKCLELANGDYIARMDGDDISLKNRLEKEVAVLDSNPEVHIVSTDMCFFDEKGTWGCTKVKAEPKSIDFLKETQFCHAASMVRREAFEAVKGYSVEKRLLRVEDYHLWVKMYEKGYKGVNIQEALYLMRDDRDAQRRKKFKYRLNESYVKGYAIKSLKLPVYGYLYCIKPIIIGLMPGFLYKLLHRKYR